MDGYPKIREWVLSDAEIIAESAKEGETGAKPNELIWHGT
jgi:hypothetical protein